ncbi:unnamed protein product [Arabidopsis lyrata]|uniref:serine--tRNA ligase n=1 Tax=Arabidopsis lyrata subsp. lyrata TaxID=81972 RepID=D7KM10_ARALL|nr:hypothetical protein ARALYDRAFT_314052 [Arabidopsis lyrata subsp. lyrata]CAH8254541.1 unnamed protein product [Arabidopsis lyrata]
MCDIDLFRKNPEIIRETQRRKFASVEVVEEIIILDQVWRQRKYEYDCARKDFNKTNKEVAKLKISDADATEKIQQAEIIKQECTKYEAEVREAYASLEAKLWTMGNLIHDSVPISNDEANNLLVKVSGEPRVASPGQELTNHMDLVEFLDIVDTKRGAKVAGGRGYFLKGYGVLLNQALINYSLAFLQKKEFSVIQPNCLMTKESMAKCAQLSQFDEELYKVTGEGKGNDEKFLIATAEQPLCAQHQGEWFHPTELPIRYAGYSTCFRKEAGSHGRDTLGIFRVHQFEKVEQFCITGPDDSWEMLEEMLKNSEEFYQSLKIPYRVVSVVSGALNDAAAKKYDLEGWFPASGTYRELVSCSNCTDYQSRRLNIRYGYKKSNQETRKYVHMLNSTLCATQRTICCILENYQRDDGVDIPEVLQPFMAGVKFLPFKTKGKKSKA